MYGDYGKLDTQSKVYSELNEWLAFKVYLKGKL